MSGSIAQCSLSRPNPTCKRREKRHLGASAVRRNQSGRFKLKGDVIERRLKTLGWSQTRLAAELGVNDATIRRWLSSRGAYLDNILRLAQRLGVPHQNLIDGFESVDDAGLEIRIKLGDLSKLSTESENKLVAAINNLYWFAEIEHDWSPDSIAGDLWFYIRTETGKEQYASVHGGGPLQLCLYLFQTDGDDNWSFNYFFAPVSRMLEVEEIIARQDRIPRFIWTVAYGERKEKYGLDPELEDYLKRLCKADNIKVFVSSSQIR
jgi:transcriptional regulator with XRE-family HTH domain